MDKEDMINTHTHTQILSSHKKEWDLPICDNMDESWQLYAKWNKIEKDKYVMISDTCGLKKNS